jgi:hypothetical protein
MSTKTLRKRVALVAVAALGAGVLSVAPAYAGTIGADEVNITTTTGTPGVCYVSASQETAYVLPTVAGVVLTPTSQETGVIELSGPGAYSGSAVSGITYTGGTYATLNDTAGHTLTVKPTGAVGTIKITTRASATDAASDVLYIYVVASCDAKVLSADETYIAVTTSGVAGDATANATNTDTTAEKTKQNGLSAYISVSLADQFANALDTGAFVATVTSGDAFVNSGEYNASLSAGKTKTTVLSTTGNNIKVRVDQSVADKPTVAVVSMTFNGTAIGSKSITFVGAATQIVVTDLTIGQVGGSGYFRYEVKDSAGNQLPAVSIADDAVANGVEAVANVTSGFVVGSSVTASVADGGKSAAVTSTNIGLGTVASYGCTAKGAAKLNLKYTNAADNVVKTAIDIMCSDVLDTWTVSMDKASYAPGEIATLTISGKDKNGLPVYSLQALTGVTASLGGMTEVVAPSASDTFTSGAGTKTYQYKVDTTEGAFVGVVKVTGATDTKSKTIQYKIAGAAGVTNADVLKAIVSLIASINKQIAALQKALLKK